MRVFVAAMFCLLLLPACGARTTDPTPVATGTGNELARADLETMVVPQYDIGGLPLGLRLSSASGWQENRAAAEGSLDPSDSAASLAEAGRITGYELNYFDPTRAAIRSGSGMDTVLNWVELFSSASAASAYLHDRADYTRGLADTSPREGISFGAVTPFEIRMADEAYGVRETGLFSGARLFRTIVSFRRGDIVAGGMIIRADSAAGSADVERLAGLLDSRIQTALRGGANGEPVLIPKDGVPLDGQQPTAARPAGAPDLAAIALKPADLPRRFQCEPGRYTHTTPPRITFRRSFCPEGATVGHTSLVALTSEVSAFDSEAAAKVSLSLTVESYASSDGLKVFAANFAGTSGLIPTHIRSRRMELEGGGIGLLTTFDTKAGRVVDFYAFAQSGRGIATLDAIGSAKGFDYRDILPLLHAVERRLGTLG